MSDCSVVFDVLWISYLSLHFVLIRNVNIKNNYRFFHLSNLFKLL